MLFAELHHTKIEELLLIMKCGVHVTQSGVGGVANLDILHFVFVTYRCLKENSGETMRECKL